MMAGCKICNKYPYWMGWNDRGTYREVPYCKDHLPQSKDGTYVDIIYNQEDYSQKEIDEAYFYVEKGPHWKMIDLLNAQLGRIHSHEIELELRSTEQISTWDASFPPDRPYNGIHHWVDGDGFQWFVFIDCGEWDYIDCVCTPDEKIYTNIWIFPQIHRPEEELTDTIWKVAGYCRKFLK